MIIFSQIIMIVFAFVGGIFATAIIKKVKYIPLEQQNVQNRITKEHINSTNNTTQKQLAEAGSRYLENERNRLRYHLEDQERIKNDILNRNIPRKIKRITRELEEYDTTLAKLKEDRDKLIDLLHNGSQEDLTVKKKVDDFEKDILIIEFTKEKLRATLVNLEIFREKSDTNDGEKLAAMIRESNKRRKKAD